MLLVDTTGSMESALSVLAATAAQLRQALQARVPDLGMGVVDVRDYPYGEAALAQDWPYRLASPVSTDAAPFAEAVAALVAGGGGDQRSNTLIPVRAP